MSRRGREINIPKIEEFNQSYSRYCNISEGFRGRPSKVLLRLLLLGVEQGWYKPKEIYEKMIWFGFDEGWFTDFFLLKSSFAYWAKDMNWKRKQSISKILEEGDGEVYG